MIRLHSGILLSMVLATTTTLAAEKAVSNNARPSNDAPASVWRGPLKDVSYQIVWLVESDDQNRKPYAGPARDGLSEAGFGRLVQAGSVRTSVTIGQQSSASGASRYGPMTVSTSMLNTTEADQLQIKIDLHTKTRTPITVDTTLRVRLDHWFLLAAADSRVGLPLHAADGKRSVLIMKIAEGVKLLD